MRMTDDESLVARLATTTTPGSVLGRLPQEIFNDLVPGCPLLAILRSGQPLADSWRDHYVPSPSSLYATLLFLRSLDSRPLEDVDAYRELLNRRTELEEPLSGPMLEI